MFQNASLLHRFFEVGGCGEFLAFFNITASHRIGALGLKLTHLWWSAFP